MADRWVVNASPVILLGKTGVIHLLGLIPSARPTLEKLRGSGAYVSDDLIDRAIALAGET
jgi:hypothetical protein